MGHYVSGIAFFSVRREVGQGKTIILRRVLCIPHLIPESVSSSMQVVGTVVDAKLVTVVVQRESSLSDSVAVSAYQRTGIDVFCFQIIADTLEPPYNVSGSSVSVGNNQADDSASIIGNLYSHFCIPKCVKAVLFPSDNGIEA